MEIKINIPQNTYTQPTEVRPEVVQGICDSFLADNCWTIFHPGNDGGYRQATHYIVKGIKEKHFSSFTRKDRIDEKKEIGIRVHGVEMKAAFEALQKAGYYMFRIYEYGSWMGYICRNKPYYEGGTRVKTFDDFID